MPLGALVLFLKLVSCTPRSRPFTWAVQREVADPGVAPAAEETPGELLETARRDAGLGFFKLCNDLLHFLCSIREGNLKGSLGSSQLLQGMGHLGEGVMQVASLIIVWR